MEAYAIFEGGGAKGYAHIGALKAAEERGIEISAVAGTSIGAVIACLVAAGFRADELFHVDTGGNKQGALSLDPLDKLDRTDWADFGRLKDSLSGYSFRQNQPIQLNFFQRATHSLLNSVRRWIFRNQHTTRISWKTYVGLALIWLHAPSILRGHRRLVTRLFKNLGFTNSTDFRGFIDAALRSKLPHVAPDQVITFAHLAIPLKVIAADLVSEEIVVFPRTPEDSVVDAVIASASFPVFFEPVTHDGMLLVDGGILSNRPAWVFDDERKKRSDYLPTFAFLLVDRPLPEIEARPNQPPKSVFHFLVKLARTTIFGRKHLETRAIDGLFSVEVAANVGVLNLADAFAKAGELVERGRQDATKYFLKLIGPRNPALMKKALESVSGSIYQLMTSRLSVPADIRCSILVQSGPGEARLSYASYQPYDDYGASISMQSPGAASIFARREPILTLVDKITPEARNNPAFKYEHALRYDKTKYVYSLPIFKSGAEWDKALPLEREEPIAVFSVSSTDDIQSALSLPEVEDMIASFSQLLSLGLSPEAGIDWLQKDPITAQQYSTEPASDWRLIGPEDAYLASHRTVRRAAGQREIFALLDELGSSFIAA